MKFDAIIFDFDGVLLESEFEGNRLLAELLTDLGHPHQRRGGDQALRRARRAAVHRRDRAADRRPAAARIPRAPQGAERRARCAKGSTRSPARSISSARCRRICPRRSLRRARRAGSAAISTISAWPTRSASTSTAAASMSSAASRRPTSISMPPTRSASPIDALRDHRGFGGRRDGRAGVGRDGDRPRRGRALLRRPRRHAAGARRRACRAQFRRGRGRCSA